MVSEFGMYPKLKEILNVILMEVKKQVVHNEKIIDSCNVLQNLQFLSLRDRLQMQSS